MPQAIPWAERAIRYGPEVRTLLARISAPARDAISFVILGGLGR